MSKNQFTTQYEFLENEFMGEIHSLRSKSGWGAMGQVELAELTGLSQATIHRFMKGKRELKISEFLLLCDLIERSPTDFFHRQWSKEQIETFRKANQ